MNFKPLRFCVFQWGGEGVIGKRQMRGEGFVTADTGPPQAFVNGIFGLLPILLYAMSRQVVDFWLFWKASGP